MRLVFLLIFLFFITEDVKGSSKSTQFLEKESGLLAAYPDAMKEFNGDYAAKRDIDNKTAYLFFFDQFGAGGSQDRDADGFMPRNKQFGYMFTKGFNGTDELYAAAAHELGHGMFVLKHTFDKDYGMAKGATGNLMDYAANVTHVAKWQWDLMHDKGVVVRVFEKDEDAMITGMFYDNKILPWVIAEYKYRDLGGVADVFSIESRADEQVDLEYYTLSPHYNVDFDGTKKLSYYIAVIERNKEKYHFDYIVGAKQKAEFIENEKSLYRYANLVYMRPLSDTDLRIMASIPDNDMGELFAGLGEMWVQSITSPEYWVELGFMLMAPQAKFAKLSQATQQAITVVNKAINIGWRTGLSKLAQLGYKCKLVGADMVLYCELGKEIARFKPSGALQPVSYLTITESHHYNLINEFDNVYFYNASGKENIGKLQLWKAKDGTHAWKIVNQNEKLWTFIDEFVGDFNGNQLSTYYDVRVTYQSNRVRAGVAFSNNNILEFHLNIPEVLQKQGLGSVIFRKAIDDYFPTKVKGWWKKMDIYTSGESTNLTIFKQKILEGLTPEQAAFETPTGKILKANGFNGPIEIVKNTPDEIIVYFNQGN